MASRKSDKPNSRSLLLAAAEDLMRESGYAAVTSRKLAAKAGLKPQLVHYYFETMDDLFLALFRDLAAVMFEQQAAIEHSRTPLRDLWNLVTDTRGTLLNYEFVALANHRKLIRAEIAEFGNRFRQGQTRIIERILANGPAGGFPGTPAFASMLINCLGRAMRLDDALGMTEGHVDAAAAMEELIALYDGPGT